MSQKLTWKLSTLNINVQFDRISQKLNESREKSLKKFWDVNESLSMSNWLQQSQLGDRLL